MARVAAQYAYMVSSDFESPEARYALGPYTPVDPEKLARKQDRVRKERGSTEKRMSRLRIGENRI